MNRTEETGERTDSTQGARQRLDAALRSRPAGARPRRGASSRLRLEATDCIARAARSTGSASRRVDAAILPRTEPATANELGLGATLRRLARDSDLKQAELIESLARFDELQLWKAEGAKHCVAWICCELGVGRSLAYAQLSCGRKLRELPIIAALFRDGELSWSKVQALARVATPHDERALAIMALDHDANEVQRLCDEYRWRGKGDASDDAARDRERFERRAVTWSTAPDGSVVVRAVLPPDMAANFLTCLEQAESLQYQADQPEPKASDKVADEIDVAPRRTARQRRADALVAMAEASLGAPGDGASSADRFQVVVNVDADALEASMAEVAREAARSEACGEASDAACGDAYGCASGAGATNADTESSTRLDDPRSATPSAADTTEADADLPLPIRAAIDGVGGITPSMARRLACDGSLLTVLMKHGEPLALGRKTRRWSPATRRAVLARDGGCCTFPGCGATRHLDVHHLHGWAFGGETSVTNGTTLCRSCHTKVHDEGWRITRVNADAPPARHQEAARLLDGADEHTHRLTRVLDARRTTLTFERAGDS